MPPCKIRQTPTELIKLVAVMAHIDQSALLLQISKRIKRLRESADLSLRGLARNAGVSLEVVQRLENVERASGKGGPRLPNLKSIVLIADALGVDILDLLGEPEGRRGERPNVARLTHLLANEPDEVVEAVAECAGAIVRLARR